MYIFVFIVSLLSTGFYVTPPPLPIFPLTTPYLLPTSSPPVKFVSCTDMMCQVDALSISDFQSFLGVRFSCVELML